jgi:hypothetical protein
MCRPIYRPINYYSVSDFTGESDALSFCTADENILLNLLIHWAGCIFYRVSAAWPFAVTLVDPLPVISEMIILT